MGSLAERYEAGDHTAVWDELSARNSTEFGPAELDDVARVCELTMQRFASNVATLVVRLTLMGYRFGTRYSTNLRRQSIEDLGLRESMEQAGRDVSWIDQGDVEESVMGWGGPRADIDARLLRSERLLGALPLALRALIRRVDTVDLSGSFPNWEPSAFNFDTDGEWPAFGVVSDPFNLTPIELAEDYRNPATGRIHRDFLAHGRFPLPIKVDHKLAANFAGAHVTVSMPTAAVDPVLDGVYQRPQIRLVEYLRTVCDWGGFPGFAFADEVPAEIGELKTGLVQF